LFAVLYCSGLLVLPDSVRFLHFLDCAIKPVIAAGLLPVDAFVVHRITAAAVFSGS
jgi:hypothetical protein